MAALISQVATAADPEGCLLCHRYRGLSRLDSQTGDLRLFFCSAEYYAYQMGPHARLRCTDCHDREGVSVFPHHVETPVDCTQSCHLEATGRFERRFSHSDVMRHLEGSVHGPDNLREVQEKLSLLGPGQSVCLNCHDEPLFRYNDTIGNKNTQRCQTCHTNEVPLDMEYFIRHTASRMQPARPVRQLIQVCAVCHSDPTVVEKTDGHDPVASYLHSFHGKANLLGSHDTATCLDCHANETGNAHAIFAKENPQSTTHASQVDDTCRSALCHTSATPGMSNAAVHLPLDPQARTPEFYVAAFFIILTAATLSLFFLILVLELLGAVIRRIDPEDRRLIRLARKIQAHPEYRKKLERMNVHQRLQHWLLAITFIGLVYTGMCIKFADRDWAAVLVNMVGGLTIARNIHRVCGVTLLAGFVYHFFYVAIYFIRLRRRLRREGRRESLLQSILNAPMMITLEDIKDVFRLFGYLFMFRSKRPVFHRFGFMEKFEYWAVTWGCSFIGLSGAFLWATEWTAEHFSGRALNFAYIIHSDEAYLAFVYIAVVHFFSVIFSPSVFPISLGSLTGYAPAREVAEKHGANVDQIARELNITVKESHSGFSKLATFSRELVRRSYAATIMALILIIWFVSMEFLITHLITRETAPTDIIEIPKKLNMAILQASQDEYSPVGGKAEPLTRGPLAHFHQIPPWFQTDAAENCTISGCHTQLPHGKKVETRAFLNMHTTFLDCGICHIKQPGPTAAADWFDLDNGARRDTPAVLQLVAFLEIIDRNDAQQLPAINEKLIALLRQSLAESNNNYQLDAWLVHLETTNPQSRLWQIIIDDMQKGLRLHLHGEYHAKIALDNGSGVRPGLSVEQKNAVNDYLHNPGNLTVEQSKVLLKTIHQGVSDKGLLCTPCHNTSEPMLDFLDLGYNAKRTEYLQNSPLARQMQQIQQGRDFVIYPHPEGGF